MTILSVLDDRERDRLQTKKLSKGETLFHEGETCHHIGIMKKGTLIITSYLENGSQIIYNTLNKDEMFGNNLLFSSSPYYKGDVLAEENSEVVLIEKEDLLFLLSENPGFLKEYLKIQSDAGKNLHFRIRLLSIDSARERFYYYMHEHSNVVRISSVSSLAKQLLLSRETLSRLLSTLTKEKRIIKEGNVIRLL